MDWKQLLSAKRLGSNKEAIIDHARNSFQQDFDRIVFSASFRRLQDKTQVFSLTTPDYVRTRLTHSLETSSVGRSLGMMAGAKILERDAELNSEFQTSDFGAIVATACLAHDIGNPPFGHNGEAAIGHWFANTHEGQEICRLLRAEGSSCEEFTKFEGNAQGFRILTQLEHHQRPGGLQLTCATLASFMKYPRSVTSPRHKYSHVADKKFGFFLADMESFKHVVELTGMKQWTSKDADCLDIKENWLWYARHPLAYLVEAADDLCYRIVDIEDGYRQRLVEFHDAEELLMNLLLKPDSVRSMTDKVAKIEFLRAKAVGDIILQVAQTFDEYLPEIMEGNLRYSLIDLIPKAKEMEEISDFAMKNIYCDQFVHKTEIAGFAVLGKLMEIFLDALNERATKIMISAHTRIILSLFPNLYFNEKQRIEDTSLYERVLMVTDYVSSLTDRKAVSLFKQLTGISLTED